MFNFKITSRLFLVLLLIFLVIGWKAKTAQSQSTGDKPVEQVRKNIQVLKGLPDSQLFLLMNFVGDSLGVNCDHCHVKGEKNPQTGEDTWLWEREDKREKAVARDEMRMVIELNRARFTRFNREAVVSCYTCHRGSTRPERMAPLPPRDYFGEALKPKPKRVLPTAQEVIAKYLSVLGANRQGILSQAIVMRGTVERVERAKASGPIEIVFKQPNKTRVTETLTSGIVTRGWNGTTAWIQSSKGVSEVTGENLKAMKATPTTTIVSDGLFSPIKIPDSPSRATLIGVARINDRESYQMVIEDSSTPSIQLSTQLFFDVESGLLLRRVNVTNTMLGPLNVQWDFSDYRDVSGIKLPFLIRTSDVASFDTVVRRFSEIKVDSSLNENVFDIPRGPSSP